MAPSPAGRNRGIHLHCEFDGLTAELRAQDLSQAGVFVITTTPPALDRELELLLHSDLGTIAVRGQVVQIISPARARAEQRSPGFGLLFVDLADDQRAFIGLTLDALQRAESAAAERARRGARELVQENGAAPKSAPRRSHTLPRAFTAPHPDPAVIQARAEQEALLARRRAETLGALEQTLASLRNQTAWMMLGLEPGVDVDTARRAYLACSKRYHPHVYAHLDSPEITRLATELFIAHKRAYATLTSLRPAAIQTTPSRRPPEGQAPPPPRAPRLSMSPAPSAATRESRPGEGAGAGAGRSLDPRRPPCNPGSIAPGSARSRTCGSGNLPEHDLGPRAPTTPGLPHLKRRVADTEIALGAGLKHLAASRFDDAAADLARARELCPDRRDITVWLHVCRARKLKAAGRAEAAVEEYRTILEHEPDHREALEHVGSGRAPRRRGGIIGKWFGTGNE